MFPRGFPSCDQVESSSPRPGTIPGIAVPSLPLLSGECRGEVVMIIVLTLDIRTVLQSVSVSNRGSSDLDKMV